MVHMANDVGLQAVESFHEQFVGTGVEVTDDTANDVFAGGGAVLLTQRDGIQSIPVPVDASSADVPLARGWRIFWWPVGN